MNKTLPAVFAAALLAAGLTACSQEPAKPAASAPAAT